MEGNMATALKLAVPAPPIPSDARCIIYTRVSTEDQADDDRASLAVQERECRAFAAKRGFTVDAVWSDPGESGRSTARLERLTKWCEAHRRASTARGLIIALKADRWGRFVHDEHANGYYKFRLAKAGWDVDFALEPTSENRAVRRVTAVIHEMQAEEESVGIGQRAYNGILDSCASRCERTSPSGGSSRSNARRTKNM
jgi:DNA invertase Pin-like site-specific DNA recombinase